jgi:hypothetical protein
MGAVLTFQSMKIDNQHAFLSSHGAHEKPPGLLTLERGFTAPASRTANECIGHLGTEDHRIRFEMSRRVANTLQPKSMI